MLYYEIVLEERLSPTQPIPRWTYPLQTPRLETVTLFETPEAFEQAHPDYEKRLAREEPIAWTEGYVYRRPDGRYVVCEPVSWQDIVDAANRALQYEELPEPFLRLAKQLGDAYTSAELMELIEEPSETELCTVLEYAQRARADWLAGPCTAILIEWFNPFQS